MKQGVSELLTPFFIGGGGKLAAEVGVMATDIKKPAEAGSKPKLLLLVSDGVWRSRINSTRFHNES
ncbi:TPA: hypothetical protein JTK96_003386 [Escherichia coli]|uniref:hypothetical protein n=1 Tax=Escherichia coli TaxID=562 RepID=UPI00209B2935|nr:hypothetical protein [Escherichia coli]MCO7745999.1 hypothetical protein [Escherichia coli]MCO7756580.1 hypothetical protein [Escherichia coli]MCO7761537.1 hypothetical protein [Escherichia coli]MCO7766595.1 hypothetical protein [Escherichia coli]MCO7771560.1 hypothetical protein [Escherichia coli]